MPARPGVWVLNTGSSSLKYQWIEPASGETVAKGVVERIGSGDDVPDLGAALEIAETELSRHSVHRDDLVAVAHRVVHGGSDLTRPTVVDDEVEVQIERLVELAPLHNPVALEAIRRAREKYPSVPQVAVFDTAYFHDLPAPAATYAIDAELAARYGVRRFGAHGISHEYVATEAARHLDRPLDEVNLITMHLGNGASITAIRRGRPVETSMGMTPLEGLVMGTRAGDIDAGVLLQLIRNGRLSADDLDQLLNQRSGLLGLTGHSDFRDMLAASDTGDERSALGYQVYCHRLRKYVGAYLALLGEIDCLVFTGGVGEHSPRLRGDALAGLERFGIELDPVANESARPGENVISPPSADVTVLVVATNEELAMARAAVALLAS